MKSLKIFGLFSLLFTSHAYSSVSGENFEFSSYFRAGTGTSSRGGDQECFNNSGSQGNEFRLGNECGIYGEMRFDAFFPVGGKSRERNFKMASRFDFFPNGHTAADVNQDIDGTYKNVYRAVELYIEANNIFNNGHTYWIGKKYNRTVDAHMMDFFYTQNINGMGAGIKGIKTSNGKVSFAQMREIEDIVVGGTRYDKGRLGTTFWDARWDDFELAKNHNLYFWLGYGHAPGGKNAGVNYAQASGKVGAIRYRYSDEDHTNDFSVTYGDKLMESLQLGGDASPIAGNNTEGQKNRLRVVDHYTGKITENLFSHFIMVYEKAAINATKNQTWLSLGARPVYFFNDHFSLAVEVGQSEVKNDTETTGKRTLTRFTIAPQLSLDRGIWSRPVLRAFYTHSSWNDANKSYVAASGAPSYATRTSGSSFGFQGEIWF